MSIIKKATLFVRYHPFLGDGDVQSWLKALSKLENTGAKIIVPGHGPVSTVSDMKDLEVYLTEFDKQAKVLCAGKTNVIIQFLFLQKYWVSCNYRKEKATAGL
jgi:glyoxylase-like metal-dependent hydrolase (beta-lactamase superfamily II)